jgi:hypothetical protein
MEQLTRLLDQQRAAQGLGRLGRLFLTYARARAQAHRKQEEDVLRAHARNSEFGVPGVPDRARAATYAVRLSLARVQAFGRRLCPAGPRVDTVRRVA